MGTKIDVLLNRTKQTTTETCWFYGLPSCRAEIRNQSKNTTRYSANRCGNVRCNCQRTTTEECWFSSGLSSCHTEDQNRRNRGLEQRPSACSCDGVKAHPDTKLKKQIDVLFQMTVNAVLVLPACQAAEQRTIRCIILNAAVGQNSTCC